MGEKSAEYKLVMREFEPERDYKDLHEWWVGHGSRAPLLKFLPKTGIMITMENLKICAGFLYKTDSKLCVFEFMVCNPLAPKAVRSTGLDMMIDGAKEWAKENGFEFIYTCANMHRYRKRLEEKNFIPGDGGQQHFLYEVL